MAWRKPNGRRISYAQARRAVVGEFDVADLARTAERLKALGYLE